MQKKSTPSKGKSTTPRRKTNARANQTQAHQDELTAERVRAILTHPATGEETRRELLGLIGELNNILAPEAPSTPDFMAALFVNCGRRLRALAPADGDAKKARPIYASVRRLAEQHEPAPAAAPAADSIEALALHLSGVMNHPLTPPCLYNEIGGRLADLEAYHKRDTPEFIAATLHAYHAADNEEGGER